MVNLQCLELGYSATITWGLLNSPIALSTLRSSHKLAGECKKLARSVTVCFKRRATLSYLLWQLVLLFTGAKRVLTFHSHCRTGATGLSQMPVASVYNILCKMSVEFIKLTVNNFNSLNQCSTGNINVSLSQQKWWGFGILVILNLCNHKVFTLTKYLLYH